MYSEIIAFSEYPEDESSVLVILATGIDSAELQQKAIDVKRIGMEIQISLDDDVYCGIPENNNQFNWKRAKIGSMSNDLTMSYTDFHDFSE